MCIYHVYVYIYTYVCIYTYIQNMLHMMYCLGVVLDLHCPKDLVALAVAKEGARSSPAFDLRLRPRPTPDIWWHLGLQDLGPGHPGHSSLTMVVAITSIVVIVTIVTNIIISVRYC